MLNDVCRIERVYRATLNAARCSQIILEANGIASCNRVTGAATRVLIAGTRTISRDFEYWMDFKF